MRRTLPQPDVEIDSARLGRLLATETLAVNSVHHQGIARLAPGLVAVATSPDGLIEGVEAANGHFLIGVQ